VSKTYRFGVLFAGLGGLSRGFKDAGLEQAFAVDFDAAACRDHETICGDAATVADLATMTPDELRALSPVRPDVLISSPPCVAFSGCLPQAQSVTPEYQAISSLAFRGIWLALEAWQDSPPPLILIENVPRIQSRGREWLDDLAALFDAYGYKWQESTHDCGELGGLAQHRRRFLGVARHRSQVPEFLYEPPMQRVKGIGEVLEALPVPLPHSAEGGAMHALPRLSLLNWIRLALIPAGKDWRALPESVAVACEPRSGVYGVNGWQAASGTVVGEARIDNGMWAVCDPRSVCSRREGALGVTGWASPTHAVIGAASIQNTALQVADPRIAYQHRGGAMGVDAWGSPAGTVIGEARSYQGANVADPRLPLIELDGAGPLPPLEDKRPIHAVIEAEDGTWHRPLTTMELFALQGFEPQHEDGRWIVLDGKSAQGWRKRIGNAVPPPAARAIGASCLRTLIACDAGGLLMSGEPVWVGPAYVIRGWEVSDERM
jgi:site-specific DNA-cytosine methylase